MSTPGVGRGEAQVFNLGPFVNQYLREQQQQKLERQAIDKQISDDLAKYTPDGIRQQDVPQFLNQYQELKDLSLKYRDAIRNPAKNPAIWSEYQNAKSRLTGLIAQSKAAKENTKALYDFRSKNLDKLDDEAFKAAMLSYNSPIGTPEFDSVKDFDQSQLIFKAPRMDVAKLYAPINQMKPEEAQIIEPLPTGQFKKLKTLQRNPAAVAQYMSSAYDTDLLNAKKGFNDMFDNTPDEELMMLEDYAKKHYDPNFKIESPRDLAVASGLYGRVDRNESTDIGGSPYLSNQAFQQKLQNQRIAHSEKVASQKKKKDDFIWETNMSNALSTGNLNDIQKLSSELETATPGVEKVYIKSGVTPPGVINVFKKNMKLTGVDGKTKYLNDADYKAGVLLVAVPKTYQSGNKKGERIKKNGVDEYEYMAVSAKDPYRQNRLNRLRNFATGGSIKPLTDKVYEQDNELPGTTGIAPLEFGWDEDQ